MRINYNSIILSVLSFTLIFALFALCMTDGMAATTGNLITNPGAENGTTGWNPSNGFQSDDFRKRSGSFAFTGGANTSESSAYQDISISQYARAIDAGQATLNFSGYFLTIADLATVRVANLDGFFQEINATAEGMSNNDVWEPFTLTRGVTANARYLRTTLKATNIDGGFNNGWFDDLSLTLTIPTPTLAHEAPLKGTNNKVNLAVGSSAPFQVSIATNVANATISEYQWQWQTGSNPPDANSWQSTSTDQRNFGGGDLTRDPGDQTVYVRVLDGFGFTSAHLAIPVRVWNRPTVQMTPPTAHIPADSSERQQPDKASWLGGKYVGVVDESVKLSGNAQTQNSDGSERITRYVWDIDNDGTFELEGAATFYLFPSGLLPQTLDRVESYIIDNQIPADRLDAFDTIDFPPTTGQFKHQARPTALPLTDRFFARFNGVINVAVPGVYQFHVASDDAFRLKISGTTVAEFVNPRGFAETTESYTFDEAGVYPFELTFVEWSGAAGLRMQWTPPGGTKTLVPIENQFAYFVSPNPLNRSAPNGIQVKAITNFGIESEPQQANLTVYPQLQIDAEGPHVGGPGVPVTLNGTVNTGSYTPASFDYAWFFVDATGDVPVPTDNQGTGQFTWTTDRNYQVRFEVTVTTQEGLVLSGSDLADVRISSGTPPSRPGGPYRGGIAGGNFSPIQFTGNRPEQDEGDTIGHIVDWIWTFGDPNVEQFGLFGEFLPFDPVNIVGDFEIDNIRGQLPDAGLAKAAVFNTVNFPSAAGALLHQDGTDTGVADNFLAEFTGFLVIPEPGDYDFTVSADTDAQFRLEIATSQLSSGAHQFNTIVESPVNAGTLTFNAAGRYPIRLTYLELIDAAELVLSWTPPGGTSGVIPAENLRIGGIDIRPNDMEPGKWNPTHAYAAAGKYTATLRVQSQFGRWSPRKSTTVSVIEGRIDGTVRAADLRTPVDEVRVKIASSHVDPDVLAVSNPGYSSGQLETGERFIEIFTDIDGNYRFEHLPLGSYRVIVSKIEANGTVHNFETPVKATDLTLDSPNRAAVDFVDLSVFPVGGLIAAEPYELALNDPQGNPFLIDGTIVEAIPVGTTNAIRSVPSEIAQDATGRNYSVPLFGGRYLFFAQRPGRDIRLDLPDGVPSEMVNASNPNGGEIVTITGASSQIHFRDVTKRTLTVIVEDSGGFPIQTLADLDPADPLNGRPIDVVVNHLRGTATKAVEFVEVDGEMVTRITYELPPGQYTLRPHADFDGHEIGFRDAQPSTDNRGEQTLKPQFDVDLTLDNGEVTMVVPVPIRLEFGPRPNLMDDGSPEMVEFRQFLISELGVTETELQQLEGFMFHWAPSPRSHTYAIRATANGHPVEEFNLIVLDQVSQLTDTPANEQRLAIPFAFRAPLSDGARTALNNAAAASPPVVPDSIRALFADNSIPLALDATVRQVEFSQNDPNDPPDSDNWLITDASSGDTYFLQADGAMLHVDNGTYTVIGGLPAVDTSDPPRVVAKEVRFQARKNGYLNSEIKMDFVTVLGDRLTGTASRLVSIPNVNYLVLHDPPGDNSYSYLEDTLTAKGIVSGLRMRMLTEDGSFRKDVPLYPAPWSDERGIGGVNFGGLSQSGHDLEDSGLLGNRNPTPSATVFTVAGLVETAKGAIFTAVGPGAYFLQLAQFPILAASIEAGNGDLSNPDFAGTGVVQYEVNATRKLQTPSGDSLPDLLGPGKGDLYFGEGWTLGLQEKVRLGIRRLENGQWVPDTRVVTTFDILERSNQYIYTNRDIENIISDLDAESANANNPDGGGRALTAEERGRIDGARQVWEDLLDKNLAYRWQRDYLRMGRSFEEFLSDFGPESAAPYKLNDDFETLIFSAGPAFDYSRKISESQIASFSTGVSVTTEGKITGANENEAGAGIFGSKSVLEFKLEGGTSISTSQSYSGSYDSGAGAEQTVGFVLQDDDVGDNYATRVYADPVWGTPLFLVEPGSVTSDPWEPGTNKAVDIRLERIPTQLAFRFGLPFVQADVDNLDGNIIPQSLLNVFADNGITLDSPSVTIDAASTRWVINATNGVFPVRLESNASGTDRINVYQETTDEGPFDYHAGAHYRVKLVYTGQRDLESDFTTIDFLMYPPQTDNRDNVNVRFNGQPGTYLQYPIGLTKESPVANIVVSIYPPEVDQNNSFEKEYSTLIFVQETVDAQINTSLLLKPRFADLRPPRATVESVYDGQRISPAQFNDTDDTFRLDVISTDSDVANVRVETRSQRTDGVWGEWSQLADLEWNDGDAFTVLGGSPSRHRYTFNWLGTHINQLGVGEYQIRAIATDKAGNVDLSPPVVGFRVDASKPTALTTLPDYQARERERIYRGELSVIFTDDMRATDFTPETFAVVDLLKDSEPVSGFVSYSPALRKAIFVPEVPFQPNGFYRATIVTDNPEQNVAGVHDLAGNPLNQDFVWTFRTTDAPFEETWSINLSVTTDTGNQTDGNNLAQIAYAALDGEDEQDARAVPGLSNQLQLSFVDTDLVEFERDTRPADGRLSHHWFFVVKNPPTTGQVVLRWRPDLSLIASLQYTVVQLVEFTDVDGDGTFTQTNAIPLDRASALVDNLPATTAIYTYTPHANESLRYFRLDVQKNLFVATEFANGSSGWRFFSVPIDPATADPFVNLADDLDSDANPLKLYQYNPFIKGYQIYPHDLGEVALQGGRGYFTRLDADVEVDVGGAKNLADVTVELPVAGWHAIGNPFVLNVKVDDLLIGVKTFAQAVADGDIEGTLYRWNVDPQASDGYETVDNLSKLDPWEGYWLKTNVDNLTLTIPAPNGLANFEPPLPASFNPPAAPSAVVQEEVQGEFGLRFKLTSAFASDRTTTLGTRAGAKDGWDATDRSEPPTLGQTVAAYFNHKTDDGTARLLNVDYQPALEVGESRTWTLTVFTDKRDAAMTLSWADTIGEIPDDTMLYFRQPNQEAWSDMRKVQSVELKADSLVTRIPIEIRAERYAMSPPADVSVVPGEAQVEIRWKADNNPFIDSYTIERESADGTATQYTLANTQQQFIDTDVVEEATYTYQIAVRFKSGVTLNSERFTVTVLPKIERTVLMQNYPNPFNPETWIPYELAKDANVSVEIYNAMGQLVRHLHLGFQQRGRYITTAKAVYWDGRNNLGERVASGVYFYVLKTDAYNETRKMIILK